MTVADLLERLTWREYLGWVAYFRHISPSGKEKPVKNLLDDEDALLAAALGAR